MCTFARKKRLKEIGYAVKLFSIAIMNEFRNAQVIVETCSCVMVCIGSLVNLCTPYTVGQGYGVALGCMECRE